MKIVLNLKNGKSLDYTPPRNGEKSYKKIVRQWKHSRVVKIPTFYCTVASDEISNIILFN